MDLGLEGRVALVTGASQGIGRAIAEQLVAEGARVAISSRSEERIRATADEIGARGYEHNSTDLDFARELVERVESDLGPLDVLVTNTGGPPGNPDPLGFERDEWEAAYRTLVLSPMALIESALPGMRERGFGRILNVVSSAVREPIPNLMLSNAHRASMLAAFKTLAREVAGDGVTLNSALPGRIATARLGELMGSLEQAEEMAAEQVPAGRLGTVEEFAAGAVFLCSAPASYITGVSLLIDGGLTKEHLAARRRAQQRPVSPPALDLARVAEREAGVHAPAGDGAAHAGDRRSAEDLGAGGGARDRREVGRREPAEPLALGAARGAGPEPGALDRRAPRRRPGALLAHGHLEPRRRGPGPAGGLLVPATTRGRERAERRGREEDPHAPGCSWLPHRGRCDPMVVLGHSDRARGG